MVMWKATLWSGRQILLNKSDPERFWAKVDKTHDCWEWQAHRGCKGYGLFSVANKPVLAHRISWIFQHGSLPEYPFVLCHKCDNPGCVRPDHIFVGTWDDNNRDMRDKGRGFIPPPESVPRGEAHFNAVLTDDLACQIHARMALGEKMGDLAQEFGLSMPTLSVLRRGNAWKHLNLPDLGHGNLGRASPHRQDLAGQKFGKLTVQHMVMQGKKNCALCACACGEVRLVTRANLTSGNSKSCGSCRTQRVIHP